MTPQFISASVVKNGPGAGAAVAASSLIPGIDLVAVAALSFGILAGSFWAAEDERATGVAGALGKSLRGSTMRYFMMLIMAAITYEIVRATGIVGFLEGGAEAAPILMQATVGGVYGKLGAQGWALFRKLNPWIKDEPYPSDEARMIGGNDPPRGITKRQRELTRKLDGENDDNQ